MNLDWLVLHKDELVNFLNEQSFFRQPLREISSKVPVTNMQDCESLYYKVQKYVRLKRNDVLKKEELICCFSLEILSFLIKEFGYDYFLKTTTTLKGDFYIPFIIAKHFGAQNKSQVISAAYSSMLQIGGKESFKQFYWYITGIPPINQ